MTLPLLITQGDTAGIGPEIIAMAFRDAPERMAGCMVAGDVTVMRRAAATVGGLLPVADCTPAGHTVGPASALVGLGAPTALPPRCVPVVQACAPAADGALPAWGHISADAGRMAAESIAWAARAALSEQAAGVVTAPIHKEAFSAAGLHHPGHTEYLQALAAEHAGLPVAQVPVRMMLANPELQTVLVSIHISLRQALDAVTFNNVLDTLRITHRTLQPVQQRRGRGLRIAVAGLNPHAGEGGLFGREEIDTIAPAIAQACTEGLDVHGPFAPDTVFMRARRGEFDVVVAMYHDQGLIPVKYLGVEQGVNVTLGLPFIRTSPDHGTAFDLAGTGRADPSSLLAAVDWARQAGTQADPEAG